MSTNSPELDTLNGLVNQLNLPYTLASTTDEQRELRRRLAFARRIQTANLPDKSSRSKIDVAKSYLASHRLYDDLGKLLGYLGGTADRIGDYAHDLRQLAPTVRSAADREREAVEDGRRGLGMCAELTDEEKGYLSKVLKTSVRQVKQFAVAVGDVQHPRRGLLLFGTGDDWYADVADAWAAAGAVELAESGPYIPAVLPGPLTERVKERCDSAVAIDVTQLDREDRVEVARNLAVEVGAEPHNLRAAIARAFA